MSNALIAGTVYSHAQPTITSVGTLTSLHVSGDANVDGNLYVGGTTVSAGGLSASTIQGTISGTFVRVTNSSVSRVAQRIGSTEFLFPEGVMVPQSGLPPCTIKSAMI